MLVNFFGETWRSKKQNVVARGVESELRAMTNGVFELLWFKLVIEDLKVEMTTPMKLFSDNKSAINIANNHVPHDYIKHIDIDRHSFVYKNDSKQQVVVPT